MKTRNLLIGLFTIILVLFLSSCEEDSPSDQNQDFGILPERFKVDIPSSLSKTSQKTATLKSAQQENGDTLNGNEIYEHLSTFIAVGEEAADLVQNIIWAIVIHKIDRVKQVVYVSDDDGRTKNLIVQQEVTFDGRPWEYMFTITDADSEGNEDGGIGMQVFWNKSPIEGIAIIKPYNLDRTNSDEVGDAMYSVEYSEKGMGSYEAYMIVEITDIPLADPNVDPFSINSLKMFVGKEGNEIDVYGNSNHPNAKIFTENVGFNWAFVASGYEEEDIGVAEVGLPPSSLDATSRTIILEDYSIKNVMTEEMTAYILSLYPNADPAAIAVFIEPYLTNADAPGYFESKGFVQGGTSPGPEYDELETNIEALSPYNPKEISELTISFKR